MTSKKSDRLDLLRIGWRRKSLVALCLCIGLVAGGFYYVQSTPLYQSEAKVLVVKKRPETVTGNGASASELDDYANTHRILIQSPLIIDRAIRQGNFRYLQTFADEPGDLTEAVIKKLTVGRVASDANGSANGVLLLSFRGPVADDCSTIVNTILDSYRSFLDETYRNMSDDARNVLTEARQVLNEDLQKKEAEYRAFREQSPMLWKGKEQVNPLQERIAQIETQRSALLLRQADLEGQLKTIENAKKDGKSREEMLSLVFGLTSKEENVATDRSVPTNVKDQVLPLLLEDRTLSADYGPNHPQVQAVRQRIQAMRNFEALPSSVSVPQANLGDGGNTMGTLDPVAAYGGYLHQQHDRTLAQEETLAKLYEHEYEAARKLNAYELRDADFSDSIARTKDLSQGLVKRLQDTKLAENSTFEARIIAPAAMGKKVFPSLWLVSAASVFISLLAGLGLAYLAESTDKRFRNVEDVHNQLALPVMACIPAIAQGEAVRKMKIAGGEYNPMLVAYSQPRSLVSESYRGVRTALFFSDGGEGHRVVQVTSSTAGEGKSVVAANVAVSIAQSGKRTLLIDADLRKPRQHEIFSLEIESGLTSVLAGETEYADAIQETSVANLSVLPCGPAHAATAELLSSPRFGELLEALRDQYDYVLLDSSPVLAVTDASVVAHHADGVLLVVRTSKAGRPMAERTRDVLRTLGAKILGVVVNAVPRSGASTYGYGVYGYGYGSASAEDDSRNMATGNGSRTRNGAPLTIQ